MTNTPGAEFCPCSLGGEVVKEQDCQDPGCGFQTGAAPFALECIFAAQTQNAPAGIRTSHAASSGSWPWSGSLAPGPPGLLDGTRLRVYSSLSLKAGAKKNKKLPHP